MGVTEMVDTEPKYGERKVVIDDRSGKANIEEWRRCDCYRCDKSSHWFLVADGLSPVIALQAVKAHNDRVGRPRRTLARELRVVEDTT